MNSLLHTSLSRRFYFFLVCLISIISLGKYIAIDSFIDIPEKIFLPENTWALSIFYDHKEVYPNFGYVYFAVDFLFAFSIFWFIPALYRKVFHQGKMSDFKIYRRLLLLPLVYLLADITEGIFNLVLISTEGMGSGIFSSAPLSAIAGVKIGALLLSILYGLYLYLRDIEADRVIDEVRNNTTLSKIKDTLRSVLSGNYATILISLIVFYLILKNNQGNTLLLELVLSPFNMLLGFIPLLILLSLMTLVNSYYMSFGFYSKIKENNPIAERKYFNWNTLDQQEATATRATQGNIKRYLTITYFMMATVLLLNLICQRFDTSNLSWIVYLLSVSIVYAIGRYVWKVNKKLKQLDVVSEIEFMKSFSNKALISAILMTSGLILYIVLSLIDQFKFPTPKIVSLVAFFTGASFLMAHIILIRRSTRKFNYAPIQFIKRWMANDGNLIRTQKFLGILVLLVSLYQFFYNTDLFFDHIKSINMILIYVFLGFWLLFVTTSSMVFAIDQNKKKTIAFVNLIVIIILGLFLRSLAFENQYFTTKLVPVSASAPETEQGISLKTYLEERLASRKGEFFYLVANEGGGLRANYWTLLILHKLEEESRKNGSGFYDNILATSGASGGSIGQSLYNLMQADNSYIIKQEIIDKIGNRDHLSSDLFSLCFRRPITSLIPVDLSENNGIKTIRGDYYASRKYTRMVLGEESPLYSKSTENSFKNFWNEAYTNNQKQYPLTIINSAHVEYGTEGVGSPLFEDENEKIFNGSVSYLGIDYKGNDWSTSFIDAAFLANRFPLISSPAIIPTKGHFMDAGVFDNYGISSLLDLIWYVQKKANENGDDSWKNIWAQLKGRLKLIVIANGRETYIKNKYGDLKTDQGGRLYKSSNLNGSFGAAVSTSAVKEYLTRVGEKMTSDEDVDYIFRDIIFIDLPYLLKGGRKDIQQTLRIQLRNSGLEKLVEDENDAILNYFEKAGYDYDIYLDPPLGRSLSRPVANYMKIAADYVLQQKSKDIFD
ncbi:hypothetical protein GWK08_03240 [Leptobacterium flavescens]|uniref:PNPLA domain-containing protein n=1 Tax=Leptobacterium flavescens TaxID=472055 RepID=A0A6P0UIT0_9FLAO|nr:hypothetical protein [Leptobacterium flavescens]NER12442.1 hypothetical protein [Leptobacterium flavescens]